MASAAAQGVDVQLSDFDALGPHAAAGLRAARLALACAAESGAAGRIPIAGAAVCTRPDGSLETITVGCNGRIPADGGPGYPTDHGETAAIRHVHDPVDWAHAVFATTLSPCVMCTRTLIHLHGLGLRRLVICESQSFPGRKDLLRPLEGMVLVELTSPDAVTLMERFARRHPWDWAADIGAIPPRAEVEPPDGTEALHALRSAGRQAAVVGPDGEVHAAAVDLRAAHGGNPVYAAGMLAMGRAGSAVNLRECTLAVAPPGPVLDTDALGLSALGACELFRPARLVTDRPVEAGLRATLEAAGVEVVGG